MTKLTNQVVLKECFATDAEIRSAIGAEASNPSAKIATFAYWLLNKNPAVKLHMTTQDLINQAYLSILADRNWNKDQVDFPTLVMGVMRSLASNESRKATHTRPDIIFGEPDRENIESTITATSSRIMSPEENVIENQTEALKAARLTILRAKLVSPELEILNMLLDDGLTKCEIRDRLSMTEKQFRAADRKLIRAIDKLGDTKS